jgi:hypothetical protein
MIRRGVLGYHKLTEVSVGQEALMKAGLTCVLIGLVGVLMLSVLYRALQGKPFVPPKVAAAQFYETWRSGRSNKTWLAQYAGFPNCLWIVVTQEYLMVGPHFPFMLLFLPEVFGMEYRIPGRNILAIEDRAALLPQGVQIRFRHATGDEESFVMVVQAEDRFRQAVAALRGP